MRTSHTRLKLAALLLIPLGLGVGYLNSVTSHTKSPEPAGAQSESGAPSVCPNSTPFPVVGFDYPQSKATVEGWVARRDERRMREHGWYLWAGLNLSAPDGSPIWRTWCTSTQAFAPPTSQMTAEAEQAANPPHAINSKRRANASTDGAEPINFKNPPYYPVPPAVRNKYPKCVGAPDPQTGEQQLIDGKTFQNNGDVMVAGVIYNDDAYNWIRDKNLYSATNLNGQVPSPTKTAAMPAMPHRSIVLKPMLWPVQAEGYTALPLWDNPPSGDGGQYAGFEVQQKWPRAVAVTPRPQQGVRRKTVKYLYGVYVDDTKPLKLMGPRTYLLAEVVPVDQFYSLRPDLSRLGDCDKAILDASAYWAYNREFRQGDYLAVIAMHVMTKEQTDWTFQSVWWHDRPNFGRYATDRPDIPASKAPGPWRHYLMASTYGNATVPGGRKLPVAFNPYIELAADHPVKTNCMNCHHRAAWPHKLSSYLATGPNAPDALDKFKMDNKIFDGLLTLDSMWAISDRAK